MQNIKRFYVLDSFRGLCALSVVVFHMHVVGSITELDFFRHSSLFVEFFFVLSGFVVTHSYNFNDEFIFKKFLISRTFRLFPLHLVMLFVFILLELGKLLAYRYGYSFYNVPFTGASDLSEIIPNILLLQSWSDLTKFNSFNYPSWSISIEYYVYLIFSSFMLLRGNARYIAWFVISVGMFSGIYNNGSYFTSMAMRGLSCFFAGALTYLIYKSFYKRINISNKILSAVEIVALSAIVCTVSSDFKHQPIISSLIFCFVVLIFAQEGGGVSSVLKAKAFVYIGKLSYSIYLTHAAILFCILSIFIALQKIVNIEFAPIIGGVRYLHLGWGVNNLLVFLVLCIVVIISRFTYEHVEVKGQKAGKRLVEYSTSFRQDNKQVVPLV